MFIQEGSYQCISIHFQKRHEKEITFFTISNCVVRQKKTDILKSALNQNKEKKKYTKENRKGRGQGKQHRMELKWSRNTVNKNQCLTATSVCSASGPVMWKEVWLVLEVVYTGKVYL